MPTLLLKLRNVPEDEYEEVCALLNEHDIHFYETKVGFWGIGMAGLWLRDNQQLEQAQQVLAEYMAKRQVQAKEAYEESIREGTNRTLLSTFKQQPATFLLYILALVVVLGLTIWPFLGLMES